MSAKMNPACKACGGACCSSLVMSLPVDGPADLVQWLTLRGKREANSVRLNVPCSALEDGKCSIHLMRPQNCRDYKVGGPQCIAAINALRPNNAPYLKRLAREHQTGAT